MWQLWLWPQNEFMVRDYIAMEQTAWQLVVFIVTIDKVLLEIKKSATTYILYHNIEVLLELKKSVTTDNHNNTR